MSPTEGTASANGLFFPGASTELTGMRILECASQPHLCGTRMRSQASLTLLADHPVTDRPDNYLASIHMPRGARMVSSEFRPMAAERSLRGRRGRSEIKLINGVCLKSFVGSQTARGYCIGARPRSLTPTPEQDPTLLLLFCLSPLAANFGARQRHFFHYLFYSAVVGRTGRNSSTPTMGQ